MKKPNRGPDYRESVARPRARVMKRKPTDRELNLLLREITGRMPSMPRQEGAVRITRENYEGQDRFQLIWRDAMNERRKLWQHNWRHAMATAKWANAQIEAAKGKTHFTFDEAADAWEQVQGQRVRAGDLSAGSLLAYRHHLAHSRKRFGKMALSDIESRHIKVWLLEGAEKFKYTTLNDHKGILFMVLAFAVEHRMLDVNPLVVIPVKTPGRYESSRDAPDRSDMEALARYLRGPRPYKVPELSWSSMRVAIVLGSIGLRRSEVCALRWDHIDPDTGDIRVRDVVRLVPKPHVVPRTKSPAGRRTVPTHPSVRQVLNEHAVVYKETFGECVGFVVRTYGKELRSGRDFTNPHDLSAKFASYLKAAGIVKEDGTAKYVFHELRHWAASDLVRHVDVHHAKTLIGHKNASTTLNVYGHLIDQPDLRQKIERMPNWLDEPIELDNLGRPMLPAPAQGNGELSELAPPPPETPIPIPGFAEKWVATFTRELWAHGDVDRALRAIGKSRSQVRYELKRCGLLTVGELEAIALTRLGGAEAVDDAEIEVAAPAPVRQECPIDLPEIAAGWLAPWICFIDQGLDEEAACQRIRKAAKTVRAELRRLKIAKSVGELKRRLRNKRMLELYDQGYQDREIAKLVGCHQDTVIDLRRELRKPNASKPLKGKAYQPASVPTDTRPGHKNQLKLL